jgi:hypothetical protein
LVASPSATAWGSAGWGRGGPDETHRGSTAVDADAHAEPLDAPCALDVGRVLLHEGEDAEAGEHGAFGVVLVGPRHAEVSADAVTLVRLHGPAVLLDGATHDRDALPDESLRLLGSESLAECSRPDDVGEEDRHGTDLVGERCLRRRRWRSGFGQQRQGWRRGGERGVLEEDRALELLESRAGVDSQLVAQSRPRVAERLERLGLSARPVEREHELTSKALAQRMLGDQRLQLADELVVAAEGEVRVDPKLQRGDAKLFEAKDRRLGERLVREVRERCAAPEREPLAQPVSRAPEVLVRERATTALEELLEALDVDRSGRGLHRVAARPRHQHLRWEHSPKTRHQRGERVRRRLRCVVAPEVFDEAVARDDLVGSQEQ